MKKMLFLTAVFSLLLSVYGETVPFRYGKILSAESSSCKPAIASSKMKDVSGGTWVEVVIKLIPGRTIGSFDYELESDGVKYPCRAIARNQESYDEDAWEITDPAENDKFRILFNPRKSKSGKYRLRTYRASPVYPEITVKHKSNEAFTPVSMIPDNGVFENKQASSGNGKQNPENKEKK